MAQTPVADGIFRFFFVGLFLKSVRVCSALRVPSSRAPQVALESFNTTHTINTLAFGDRPPEGHASPKHVAASTVLEGHHKTVQDTHAMHQVG